MSKQKSKLDAPVSTTTINAKNDTVSYEKDPALQVNPHDRIIALMESFKLNPEPEVRSKIMEDIKLVPKLLVPTLDKALETVIYSWRDLIQENHPETITFMLDLENLLAGENLDVIRRNFVFLLDRNAEAFVTRYSKSRDVGCKAGALFGEPVPEEERVNEFRARETNLQTLLLKETLDSSVKSFIGICLSVVRTQLSTLQIASPQAAVPQAASPQPATVQPYMPQEPSKFVPPPQIGGGDPSENPASEAPPAKSNFVPAIQLPTTP